LERQWLSLVQDLSKDDSIPKDAVKLAVDSQIMDSKLKCALSASNEKSSHYLNQCVFDLDPLRYRFIDFVKAKAVYAGNDEKQNRVDVLLDKLSKNIDLMSNQIYFFNSNAAYYSQGDQQQREYAVNPRIELVNLYASLLQYIYSGLSQRKDIASFLEASSKFFTMPHPERVYNLEAQKTDARTKLIHEKTELCRQRMVNMSARIEMKRLARGESQSQPRQQESEPPRASFEEESYVQGNPTPEQQPVAPEQMVLSDDLSPQTAQELVAEDQQQHLKDREYKKKKREDDAVSTLLKHGIDDASRAVNQTRLGELLHIDKVSASRLVNSLKRQGRLKFVNEIAHAKYYYAVN
jgi:hypothetical protein